MSLYAFSIEEPELDRGGGDTIELDPISGTIGPNPYVEVCCRWVYAVVIESDVLPAPTSAEYIPYGPRVRGLISDAEENPPNGMPRGG
jgi:hypothetical protein